MDPPAGPPAAARPAESEGASPPASASSPARYKVLVVDDDEDSRTLVRQTLLLTPDFTSDVTLADSAKAGLAWLDQEKFDVVISDQIMPETNGIEFLMEVKQRFPETLRILITAHTGLETVLRAVNLAQVHAYIEKPLDPLEVNRILREAITRMQTRRQSHTVNVVSVQEALRLVHEVEDHLVVKPRDPGSLGLDLVFESPVDFNRFTFEILRSRTSLISDVHVFEGKFHVVVQVLPRLGPVADPSGPRS